MKAPQATRDLGMARADRSAGWLPGEHPEARTTTARSVSPYAPVFPSWEVGNGPPVLSFSSAVFVCGIPRSECVICRVPLFHRHEHTPYYDSAIRQPVLLLPQVAGAAQEPRARFPTNTIHLLFCKAAQPRSSEKNAASRAGQTPWSRWAVGICYTRAKSVCNGFESCFRREATLSFFYRKPRIHGFMVE